MIPVLGLTSVAAATLATALISAVVWWLIRKRLERVWLPTVRILDIETHRLPRIVLLPPPWFAWVCFVVAAAALGAFSLRPHSIVLSPEEPRQQRIHVLVDLSPSMSARTSIFDLGRLVSATWERLSQNGRVSIGTTHDDVVVEPVSADEAARLVESRGFHRAGARLGSALRPQLLRTGQIDKLIVLADEDLHSWNGFNWSWLAEDMDVLHVSPGAAGVNVSNHAINSAQFLSTPASLTMDWDVEIVRSKTEGESSGTLRAVWRETVLSNVPWQMSEGRERVIVRVSWPAMQNSGEGDPPPIVWTLDVSGDDVLAADDEYRTPLQGLKQDIQLIAAPNGEQILDDPSWQLQVAMEVLGFRVRRLDRWSESSSRQENWPLWIVVGGSGQGADMFCPASLEAQRLAATPQRKLPAVWLLPMTVDADFSELCECYARLVPSPGSESGKPAWCADLNTRELWTGLLKSLGAKQLGGAVGEATGALAWTRKAQSGLEVTAFTVPLRPSPQTGLSHASLPVLVKQLMTWAGVLAPSGSVQSWPRIADLTEAMEETLGEGSRAAPFVASIPLSNVPLTESMLYRVDPGVLPPSWSPGEASLSQVLSARREREEALYWVQILFGVAAGVTLLEVLVGGSRRVMRRSRRASIDRSTTVEQS